MYVFKNENETMFSSKKVKNLKRCGDKLIYIYILKMLFSAIKESSSIHIDYV